MRSKDSVDWFDLSDVEDRLTERIVSLERDMFDLQCRLRELEMKQRSVEDYEFEKRDRQ